MMSNSSHSSMVLQDWEKLLENIGKEEDITVDGARLILANVIGVSR